VEGAERPALGESGTGQGTATVLPTRRHSQLQKQAFL
jgi:hypothetical protein